jgi:hypothetical protein
MVLAPLPADNRVIAVAGIDIVVAGAGRTGRNRVVAGAAVDVVLLPLPAITVSLPSPASI